MTFCRRGPPIKVKLLLAAARPPVVPSVKQPSGGSAGRHGHGNVRNVAVSSFAGKQKELLKHPHTTRLLLSIAVCIVLIQSARAAPSPLPNFGKSLFDKHSDKRGGTGPKHCLKTHLRSHLLLNRSDIHTTDYYNRQTKSNVTPTVPVHCKKIFMAQIFKILDWVAGWLFCLLCSLGHIVAKMLLDS